MGTRSYRDQRQARRMGRGGGRACPSGQTEADIDAHLKAFARVPPTLKSL